MGWLQSPAHLPGQNITSRVVIGVTGHRELDAQPWLVEQVRAAIDGVRQMVPPLPGTPLAPIILSSLAEGADRLVAREVLQFPGAMLEAVLPFEKDDYIQDFKTDESKNEFEKLLSQARSVRALPPGADRDEAYEQAGRHIVDQCDVLIALWNGSPAAGRGGTQEIVQYARDTECPLIWINTEEPGQVTTDLGRGLNLRLFQDIDRYNSEQVNASKFEKQLKGMREFFEGAAENARLPSERLQATLEYTLRHYVRADILALRYQHLYYRLESLVYTLALAAVVIVAFQVLFVPEKPIILTSEIVLMLAVLAIVGISRRRGWHSKWIDYRFLAERFRSVLFMALADIDVSALRPPRHLSLAYSPQHWIVAAFLSVWSYRPRLAGTDSSIFEGLKYFTCEAWVEDQIRYHHSTRKRHYRRHYRMSAASYVMFGLTICAALLHIFNAGPHSLDNLYAFLAIVFPAIAASITAIRTHRDYLRNSMRSTEMARHLEELKGKMIGARDYNSFLETLKEAEETMLHENEDWRVVVRFHIPEVPV